MAWFRIEWSRGDSKGDRDVDVDNWMVALDTVLRNEGIGDAALGALICDVEPSGSIRVTESASSLRLLITEEEDEPTTDSFGPVSPLEPMDVTEPRPKPRSPTSALEEQAEADLEVLVGECSDVSEAIDTQVACEAALDILLRHVPAESASVLLHRPATGEFEFVAVRGPSADGLRGTRIPAHAGIAGVVFGGGRAMMVRQVDQEPRHYREIDRSSGYHTRAIIAAPVRGSHGIHGVIEVLNPLDATIFDEIHQDGVSLVAGRLGARLGQVS